jgi:maleate isomerase
MPGAGMPSVAVIDVLERDLGVPVLSSKQVMVWAALRSARVSDPVEGYGRLFSI